MTPSPDPGRTIRAAPRTYPRIFTFAAAAVVIAALRLGRPVLVPVVFSVLLSFLLAPVVARLERWRLPRVPAVIAAMTAAALLLGVVGWFVFGQVAELATELPQYRHALQQRLIEVRETFGGPFGRTAAMVEELGETVQPEPDGVVRVEVAEAPLGDTGWIRQALVAAAGALGFAGVLGLFVTFALLEKETLRDRFIWLVGDARLHVATQMIDEASKRVSRYLSGLLLVNCAHGTLVAAGLALIGVPDALLWGLVSGLLRFLPYLGPWLAATGPVLVTLAVFEGWTVPLQTIGFFVVLELFTNNVLEPRVYASRAGVTSLTILLAAFFWTWLWGPLGLVLSTPLTVCLVVAGKYVPQLRGLSILLGDTPALSSAARLYQRILARDADGAFEILSGQLEREPLATVYDATLMPALRLFAQDRRRGEIEEPEAIERDLAALVDRAAEQSAATPEARVPVKVICLPAKDSADQIACAMLRQVLLEDGVTDCEIASATSFASEMLDLIARSGAALACVSQVPPSTPAAVRYLGKRLLAERPDLRVIVGSWTGEADDEREFEAHLPAEGRFHLATSLVEARSLVRRLLHEARSTGAERVEERAPSGPRELGAAPSGA